MSLIFRNIQSQKAWNEFRCFRVSLKITQTELGLMCGLSQGGVSQYETGEQSGEPVVRGVETTVKMCEAIRFPVERFIPSIPTKHSKHANCRTLYVARASNESQTFTAYGITTKESSVRLNELDNGGLYHHKIVADYEFRHVCIAGAIERSIKTKFGYNPKVGEYLGVSSNTLLQHIEDVIEVAEWDCTMILAPADPRDVSGLEDPVS